MDEVKNKCIELNINDQNVKEEVFSDEDDRDFNGEICYVKNEVKDEEITIEDYNIDGIESERKPIFCELCNFEELTNTAEDEITENVKLYCYNCYKKDFIKYHTVWQDCIYNLYSNCEYCKGAFKNGCSIKIHNCSNQLQWKKCNAIFNHPNDSFSHDKICKIRLQSYCCEICCKTFRCLNKLKLHTTIHSGKKPYSCDRCSKSYNRSYRLKIHLRTHSGIKPHSCNICSKSFHRNDSLKRHIQTHSDEKPYTCNSCSKSFNNKDYLKKHILTHSSENPYSCNACSKSYATASYLKVHLRTHSGVKPYSCNSCSKSFHCNKRLKHHIQTHLKIKPYSCNFCSKSFIRERYIKIHLRTHSGDKPYSCNSCSKSFSHLGSLKNHLRIH